MLAFWQLNATLLLFKPFGYTQTSLGQIGFQIQKVSWGLLRH